MAARETVVVKSIQMTDEQRDYAIDCATNALIDFNNEHDMASSIKYKFDDFYAPTWHCIVGRNFGSHVTHEVDHFIYFYIGQMGFLLFKTGS
ncbi:uncharacterized protein AMSG_08736 [Thecamonas trahens ATCC 50062]|uniref:Dynein light chain n=1 Tax=Thecamonas trahens ATCC 50062 TaxID=461836 RepID=A0A0L0DP97_THETB|nr:hypothetical protein AMSG_08736 [Thecamonas trahens ATCC 50062]KNC53248.1 hypothetical protein AMSG_08736 [Thecamonas trahens ATCC 50062]|eukprot:XP_013754512.1 hypothetical protein AMSG_08736 [Thecamonas trahens ATCC 50062]